MVTMMDGEAVKISLDGGSVVALALDALFQDRCRTCFLYVVLRKGDIRKCDDIQLSWGH